MDFLQPSSWHEALAVRAERPDALPIAGGTDVMVELNFDRRRPGALLDLGRVAELREWTVDGGRVRLGAGVPYSRIIDELGDRLPGLAMASRTVGSPQIRNRGTIGGNLATASPAGDALPPLLVGGAIVVGVLLSVVIAAAVTFVVAAAILRASRKRDLEREDAGDLSAAIAKTEAAKGRKSEHLSNLAAGGAAGGGAAAATAVEANEPAAAAEPIRKIVFACDAGMGSSAMGASVLRNKIKKAGIEGVEVTNIAIANLDASTADLIVTHRDLTDRARQRTPDAVHVSVENFMNSPKYDEVVQRVAGQNK